MIARIPLSAPDITEAEISAVSRVLRTPDLSQGPELAAFESEFAAYHHLDHALAVSSGTAGLHLALLALGLGEGDEIILPSFSFVALINAVLQVRATPVLVEIDPLTLNLDPVAVEQAIISPHAGHSGRPHLRRSCGDGCPQRPCRASPPGCHRGRLEAIGARFLGHLVGSFGDLAVLGFYPNKQMTTGEGGAVLGPRSSARRTPASAPESRT